MGERQNATKILMKENLDEQLNHAAIKIDDVEILDRTYEAFRLKVRVHNEGGLKVREFIKVYIKDTNSIYAASTPTLYTFEVIELNAYEEQIIKIDLHPEAFTIIDEKGDCYRDSNEFEIYICIDSTNNRKLIREQAIIKQIRFQNIAEESSISLS